MPQPDPPGRPTHAPRSPHRARSALALVEVLLVVAILVILIGLLLTAVQKIREAAAQARCANHLKQLAIGAHAYHDAWGKFPPGGSHTPPATAACTDPDCRQAEWSWAYQLLPFLDQEGVYRNPDAAAVQAAMIPVFYCPGRRSARLYNGRAMIDYAGNAGTQPEGENGLVMRTTRGPVRLVDISDGTSTTLLIGEKRMDVAGFGRTGGDSQGYATPGWNADHFEVYRLGSEPPAPDTLLGAGAQGYPNFGASHPAVFNTVFADGAVRPVRYSVDPATWSRACVRNDSLVPLGNGPDPNGRDLGE